MRYGLVRRMEGRPPVVMERLRLDSVGCDLLIEEGPPTRVSLRAQWSLLNNLKPGDELLVCSLDALQLSTGQLVLLLQKFDQTGVTLKVVGEDRIATPIVSRHVRPLLALLAANEIQRPDPRRRLPKRRPPDKPLTRFQVSFANEMRRGGASLRTISQLFQVSPADLLRQLDKGVPPPREQEIVVSLPERRARRP